jgi:hypothetical protein
MRLRNLMLAPVVFALSVVGAAAGPVNLGFETGDFSGWSVSISTGLVEWDGHDNGETLGDGVMVEIPAGIAAVLDTWAWQPSFEPYEALEGTSFALFGTGDGDGAITRVFSGGPHEMMASQAFTIGAGHTLSGWSFFFTDDHLPQDIGFVQVFDESGALVSEPWSRRLLDPFDERRHNPWTEWSWNAPASGSYTVAVGISSRGDNAYASYAGFDRIRVPEPSSLWLTAMGAGLVLGRWRRRR